MAIQKVPSAVDVYWTDSKPILDSNFSELNQQYTVTTTATPATGTCGVQFVFKDPNTGATINYPISGIGYIAAAADGLATKTVTSLAVLTNGRILNMPTVTSMFQFTTTAAGLLGMTITASASDNYVVFVLPNGKLLVSTVCTIN